MPCKNIRRENVRRLFLARNQHARTGPRKTAQALLHVDAERERREPRQVADAFGDVLVERDGVAEAAAARMRRGGEEAVVRRMPAVHVGMRHAAEHGEIVAMLLEQFEVGRQRVIAPALLREEMFRQQAEVVADAEASGAASRPASRRRPCVWPRRRTPGASRRAAAARARCRRRGGTGGARRQRCVETNGPIIGSAVRLVFMSVTLIPDQITCCRNSSLCTISWTASARRNSLRAGAFEDLLRSARSLKRTGAPVA